LLSSLCANERLSKLVVPIVTHTVDDHRLLVQHRAVVFEDLDAGVKQASVQSHTVMPRKPIIIADARHHDAHVDASLLRFNQGVDRDWIRDEIGVRDVNRCK
jgi:hypothetical protein